jgi:hypothetical protein
MSYVQLINQQEHHKKVSFKDEYIAFIREMGWGWMYASP